MQVMTTEALLDREEELRAIDGALERARAGAGGLVVVEGPPGIGKTRLLEVARGRARESGFLVLAARASELDRAFPLGVVRQLFEPLLVNADARRRGLLLRGAAAQAAPLLVEVPEDDGPRPSLERFHALYWLTANLADLGPLALVIDDVHWADAGSQRFLEFLAPRIEGLPVLVALATRPAEPGADRRAIDAVATDALAVVV
nr:ATP-binding protein [Actinomycetota bacterium]